MLDKQNQYSNAQSISSSTTSTNYINHGADRNLGMGTPLVVEMVVTTALDAGNSDETYSAVLQTDDNSSFSSATTVASFSTMTRGDAAGTRYFAIIPPTTVMEQYSRISFTLGGTSPSLAVSAWLRPYNDVTQEAYYADAITPY